jgi:hypothetical protein
MEVVILTWVSGSWKTTIQEKLLELWRRRPINFTTREMRDESELDEYIFISKAQFLTKLKNWDFLEHVEYNGNFYGISNYFLRDSFKIWHKEYKAANLWNKIVIVAEPVWREQIAVALSKAWIKYKKYFLDIPPEVQYKRLVKRWDNILSIRERLNDFDTFCPTAKCHVLNWELDIDLLVHLITH